MKFKDYLESVGSEPLSTVGTVPPAPDRFIIGDKVKHTQTGNCGIISGCYTFGWPVALPDGSNATWHDDHTAHHVDEVEPSLPPAGIVGGTPAGANAVPDGGGGSAT